MIYRGSLLCLLLVASVGSGQTPSITKTPANVRGTSAGAIAVEADKAADLSVTLGEGDSVLWQISPAASWKAQNLPPGRLIFTGHPGTTYTVGVFTFRVVTDAAGKPAVKAEQSETTVTFAGTPPAPPTPPTPPVPPGPQSEFGRRLQLAYSTDQSGTKAADLANLRTAMSQAATTARDTSILTKEALTRRVNADTKSRVGTGRLALVGMAVGEYLDAAMGTFDAPLTQALRDAYAAKYAEVAAALAEVR